MKRQVVEIGLGINGEGVHFCYVAVERFCRVVVQKAERKATVVPVGAGDSAGMVVVPGNGCLPVRVIILLIVVEVAQDTCSDKLGGSDASGLAREGRTLVLREVLEARVAD